MQLYICKSALAKFRRRAIRRHPKEYLETLWGLVNADGTLSIVEFHKEDHVATEDAVETFDEDAGRFGIRDGPLKQLGTIHTHTDCIADCIPSEADWEDVMSTGELIMGVMTIRKQKDRFVSRLRFYFARALCQTAIQ